MCFWQVIIKGYANRMGNRYTALNCETAKRKP